MSAQNRPLSASSRRKSIPPKRRIIPPYSSDNSNSSQPSRFSAKPKTDILKLDKPKLDIPKLEVKTETRDPRTEPKSTFKLHQPKAFGKNTMLEKKISELQSSIICPEKNDKTASGLTAAASVKKNNPEPAEDVKVSEYLENLEKKTPYNKPDESMKPIKKKSEKSNKSTAKLKLGSPRKLEKMKNLRRSPRKSNSITFTQTFGLSVMSNTKLPGRIPKKKKN